jgi:hypothetical protein
MESQSTQFYPQKRGFGQPVAQPSQMFNGPSQVAVDVSGTQYDRINVIPNNNQYEKLIWKLTAGGAWAGTVIPLMPQKSSDTFPANITFSSNQFTDAADFIDMLTNEKVMLGNIMVYSDNTNNFSTCGVTFTPRRISGVKTGPYTTLWNDFTLNEMATLQNVRRLAPTFWISGSRALRIELSGMIATSYLQFTADIIGSSRSEGMVPFTTTN